MNKILQQKISNSNNVTYIPTKNKLELAPTLNKTSQLNRHYPAATREWRTSTYTYLKNPISPVIDNSTYDILKIYFNSMPKDPRTSKMFRRMSILKVFVARPEIKHSVNKTDISVLIYNRQKLYFWNLFQKSFKLFKNISSKREVHNKLKKRVATASLNNLKEEKHRSIPLSQMAKSKTNTLYNKTNSWSTINSLACGVTLLLNQSRKFTSSSSNWTESSLGLKNKDRIPLNLITAKFAQNVKVIKTNFVVSKRFPLPLSKSTPGRYINSANKRVRIFLANPSSTKNTAISIINKEKRMHPFGNKSNMPFGNKKNRRISSWMQRKLRKRIQKGNKRILYNILRKKSANVLFYSLNNYFYNKSSLLLLKRIEKYTIRLFQNLLSLKVFMMNLYRRNSVSIHFTPAFGFAIWKKYMATKSPLYPSAFGEKGHVHNYMMNIPNNMKKLSSMVKIKNTDNKSQFGLVSNKVVLPSLDFGKWVGEKVKKVFLFKYYYTMMYFYDVKSNNKHLLPLKDITKKRYGKKIAFNIVNLKYLYLDSNILAEAITTKLKDRKKRVLRVLKRTLGLIKKPYYKIHFYNKKITQEQHLNLNFLLSDKKLNVQIDLVENDIIMNKYLLTKPFNYKSRLLLYRLKHKIVSGVRVEGSGRLTRRLTASRSLSKYKYMGSLQNIDSSRESLSTVMLRGYMKSNLQYMNINNHNRNGAFGVKVSVSCY